ncbi:MAG: cation transporter [Magnetococcales bacterium]|nr:cation transporter [Magnetococcales bacterium]
MTITHLDPEAWRHPHTFGQDAVQTGERRTHWVIGLTFTTMVVELLAGYYTGSMALTADGWHMSTHAAALGITAFAYSFARRHAHDPRFTFGTGKVGTLGGFASAVALAVVSILLAWESIQRLIEPVTVHFQQAIIVAFVGLLVNVASVWLLGGSDHHHGHGTHHGHGDHHDHDDHHDHPHDHDHDDHHDHHDHHDHARHAAVEHKDYNLRAAYLHVMADALTSVTALVALTSGMYLGWVWMDPLMGVAGSVVIAVWSYGLLRDSAQVLLDAEQHGKREEQIRALLQAAEGEVEIADLHLWRVGSANYACIVSLVAHVPQPSAYYKQLLAPIPGLDHTTIEVNRCCST